MSENSNEFDPALARRSYIAGDRPIKPKMQIYPINNSKDKRRFRSCWYGRYNWLEYSISKDAAFCFVCRKFSIEVGCANSSYVLAGSFFTFKKTFFFKSFMIKYN